MSLTLDERLKTIQKFCDKYSTDEKYVFKSCKNQPQTSYHEYIVVMEKLKDTITNEERKDVFDKSYAKFRANRLNVVAILSVVNLSSVTHVMHSWKDSNPVRYEVGKVVECDKFDEDLNKVCSGGIHYFKTLIPAYYHCNKPEKGHSKYMDWYEDGMQKYEIIFFNGLLNGFWKSWNNDGHTSVEGQYEHGERYGKWIEKYRGGQIKTNVMYKHGKLNGECTEYHENGQERCNGVYVNNKKVGIWSNWNSDGKLINQQVYD